ncbi:MAG: hypothetical protein GX129_04625 [Clostridiales bacterium]|nr:hypothetical protein [Clostridiales bacterium]
MKTKILSILLVSIMVVGILLTGCSGSKKTSASAAKWATVVDSSIAHSSNIEGFLNENCGLTVGYGGEIHYTNDQGETWSEAENSSMCRYSLDIVNEKLAWSGGNGNNVRMTKDGGKTWSAVTDINLGGMHLGIDFLDDKNGWIASNKKCAKTNDGGITWTELELPEDLKGIAAICLRTTEDGYLLANNGLFYITGDGGSTWTNMDLDMESFGVVDEKGNPGLYKKSVSLADICFTDEDNGIIIFSGIVPGEGTKGFCLTTNDGGESWTSEKLEPKEGFVVNRVYISGDGLYLTLGSNDGQLLVMKRED